MLEARFRSYATHQWGWPRRFLGILAEGSVAEAALLAAQRQWKACLLAEAHGHWLSGSNRVRDFCQ
eukprot:6597393-Lingulodinium_polyedra.AAC.1